MRKIVADVYTLLLKFIKSKIISIIFAVLLVSVMNYFIMNGLIILFEGLLPTGKLLILFSSKIKYVTFILLILFGFIMNYKILNLDAKKFAKPNYARLIAFLLIFLLLVSYLKLNDMLNSDVFIQ